MKNSEIHRLLITVNGAGYQRFNKPVDLIIDNPQLIDFIARQNALGKGYLFVNEIDQNGSIIDPFVPCQYDPGKYQENLFPRLSFIAKGLTKPDQTRYYDVIWNHSPGDSPKLVEISELENYRGQPALKISTRSGIYYYHKLGGGIASLFDPEGRDWIGYLPIGGSDGKYRGIPNLKYPEAHFHPGSVHMKTKILSEGPIRVSFRTSTPDELWACSWDIWPNYATVTIERTCQNYWFLYEGTPGGKLDEVNGFIILSDGIKMPISERWETRINPSWLYFGAYDVNRIFFLAQHDFEDTISSFWPMESNMTVFGFGRQDLNHNLQKTPARFTIGLIENCGIDSQIKSQIYSSFQDLKTEVSL